MTWELMVTLVSVVGTITAIIFSSISYSASKKKDTSSDGQRIGALMTELGYIKSGIDDIKHKQEKADERYIEIITRLTAVEESTKSAHKRITDVQVAVGMHNDQE